MTRISLESDSALHIPVALISVRLYLIRIRIGEHNDFVPSAVFIYMAVSLDSL